MKISGAQAILKALELEGVETIFGYPGAAICPFYDALIDSPVRHILVRQEQCAVHEASGYARVTGKVGVCVATSGPGATNLITGIATAYVDSIPIVAITGQVTTELIGRDVFQEADITGATSPFCKHNYLVKDVEELPKILKQAFHIATTGRPGPVVVDIPVDVQKKMLNFSYPKSVEIRGYKPTYKGHGLQIKKIAEAIKNSKSPVICAGGGILSSSAEKKLAKLAEGMSIPVTTTLMGIGALPASHPLNLGMIGSHGVYIANYAINHADLVLILGARVGDRAMGSASKIAQKAQIIHVDIDPAEIGKNIGTTIPVVGDIKTVISELIDMLSLKGQDAVKAEDDNSQRLAWCGSLSELSKKHEMELARTIKKLKVQKSKIETEGVDEGKIPINSKQYVDPKLLLSKLTELTEGNIILATEVGQNQIWAANHFKVGERGRFITSGGMGTMGYGLPASIGAKLGRPDEQVVLISGDGSFQMSIQELGTIKQNNVGVKIILFNNNRLGMVRELQKINYCSRYSAVFLEENPDFIQLAKAYGVDGKRINSNKQIDAALKIMLQAEGAYILEVAVDPEFPTL